MTSNDINFLHLDVWSRSHHKVKGHRRWGVCLCECYVYFYLIYLFFFFWGGGETCFCYGYPTFAFSHGFVSSTMSMELISKSKVLNSASWYNCVDWFDMKSDVGSNILSILGHRWRSKITGLKVFVLSIWMLLVIFQFILIYIVSVFAGLQFSTGWPRTLFNGRRTHMMEMISHVANHKSCQHRCNKKWNFLCIFIKEKLWNQEWHH